MLCWAVADTRRDRVGRRVCKTPIVLALPIVGKNVMIDRLVSTDAPALSVSHSDPDNARYQGWRSPLSEGDALGFIDRQAEIALLAPGCDVQLAIREQRGGPLAGDLYLARPETAPWAVEVGITLVPGFQGRGLATGAIAIVVDALFGEVHSGAPLHRVVAEVDVDNRHSRALFERLGFRLEAHRVRSGRRRDGTFADELVFAVIDDDWRRSRSACS
jgi:RimJ/RimL family protein N-acetyltransferase